MSWYVVFNAAEGTLWMVAAAIVAAHAPHEQGSRQRAIRLATLGLVLFGLSDWFECRYEAQIPLWLWTFKVVCGGILLVARFEWRGWRAFRFQDREVLFAMFCLGCVGALIWLQRVLG